MAALGNECTPGHFCSKLSHPASWSGRSVPNPAAHLTKTLQTQQCNLVTLSLSFRLPHLSQSAFYHVESGATLVLLRSQSLTTTEQMWGAVMRDQVVQWLEQGAGEVKASDPYLIHSTPCT